MIRGLPIAFASGLLFGVGLLVGGITDPARIQGFLDVFGRWDPRMGVTMLGALAVSMVPFAVAEGRRRRWSGSPVDLPDRRRAVDGRLLAGMAIFGVGWALCGLCPAPALIALAEGRIDALVFVPSMAAGMALHDLRAELARR